MTARPHITDFPDGISAVDTEYVRPLLDASHLIVHEGRAAFVDTGTSHSVPLLLAALAEKGLDAGDVDYVLVTHVHLDHAGGAGQLMAALPNATAVLHPRGAGHMADPTRLVAGSVAVYGEALFKSLYGEIVPIPAERILAVDDGQVVELAGRLLEFLHTEGHARHHYCIHDHGSESVFSGDTFGLSYRDLDTENGAFIFPSTTPVQFDPDAAVASVDRLMGLTPRAIYLTHYSCVTELDRLAADLKAGIRAHAEIARSNPGGDIAALEDGVRAFLYERMDAHGCDPDPAWREEIVGQDVKLNAQGLKVWLSRLTRD